MLFHASKERGLKVLEPHISTHGKAYVYAINSKITALCFGAPKDDFDLLMDEICGITHLYECYPDATEKIYKNKSCSLYEVDNAGFESGKTGWDAEYVCEKAVSVQKEDYIEDIYSVLLDAQNAGGCVIHRYSEESEYQKMLKEELGERIKLFGLDELKIENDPRLKRVFELLGESS